MITRLVAAYRRWAAARDEHNRLIGLGADIVAEKRVPETDEERRAVAAYWVWVNTQW